MNRIDGQIWIDRASPYRLKYHINGVDYIVEVAASYTVPEATESISIGTVVKLTSQNEIAPAIFPDDIDSVIGVTLNTAKAGEPIAISQSGFVVVNRPEDINNLFALAGDLDTSLNGWGNGNLTAGIGAPIYWYIGRTVRNGDAYSEGSYSYEDSNLHPGKLTLSTPSGYKWNITTVDDETMNISYNNLPIVGTVASYTLSGSKIDTINIHLNFATFDSSLEWNWPGIHSVNDGSLKGSPLLENNIATFRHGLFPDIDDNSQIINAIEIQATDGDTASVSSYTINTSSRDSFKGADRKTEVNISTPESTLKYRIKGEVRYNLDKSHTAAGRSTLNTLANDTLGSTTSVSSKSRSTRKKKVS